MGKPTPEEDSGYWTRNPDDLENFVKLTKEKPPHFQVVWRQDGEYRPYVSADNWFTDREECMRYMIKMSNIFPKHELNMCECRLV